MDKMETILYLLLYLVRVRACGLSAPVNSASPVPLPGALSFDVFNLNRRLRKIPLIRIMYSTPR